MCRFLLIEKCLSVKVIELLAPLNGKVLLECFWGKSSKLALIRQILSGSRLIRLSLQSLPGLDQYVSAGFVRKCHGDVTAW